MLPRLVQPENVESLIEVILLGKFMLVRLEQPENAPESMNVTLSGISIFIRFLQPLNWLETIDVIPFPSTMLSRFSLISKAAKVFTPVSGKTLLSASAQIFVGQVKAQKIAIKPFRVG